VVYYTHDYESNKRRERDAGTGWVIRRCCYGCACVYFRIGNAVVPVNNFSKKSLDKSAFVWYIILMKENMKKKNKVQKLNDEFNKMFLDEVFMPMVTFAVTIMFVAIILDYGFQLIEAIDILTL
jgi:hypothetical protein